MDDQVLPSDENFSDNEEVVLSSIAEEEVEEEYFPEDGMEFPDQQMLTEFHAAKIARITVLLNNVLPALPAKSLLRFKSVSSFFNDTISRFFFILSHALYPKRISGLFYHHDGRPRYVSLNDDPLDMPDPSLSFIPDNVTIKASTLGILCVHGRDGYYVTNPVTMEYVKLPEHSGIHGDNVAVVVLFDDPSVYNFAADYQVVCAFPVIEGIYSFETFSSSTWTWTMSKEEIYDLENVVAASGVAVGGLAYWRTTMHRIIGYDPREQKLHVRDFPSGANQDNGGIDPYELGEMSGQLTIASKSRSGRVNVEVLKEIDGSLSWRQKGNFFIPARNIEGSGTIFRSQGKDELVIWEVTRKGELVLRNVKLGTELKKIDGPGYCADFVPFIGTLLPVKRSNGDISQEASSSRGLQQV